MSWQLSDKYDRERLALNAAASNVLRGKDREQAPHLASATGRNGQGQTTASTRRAEGREPVKKKPGEVSDDWRRGEVFTFPRFRGMILMSIQAPSLRRGVAVMTVGLLILSRT